METHAHLYHHPWWVGPLLLLSVIVRLALIGYTLERRRTPDRASLERLTTASRMNGDPLMAGQLEATLKGTAVGPLVSSNPGALLSQALLEDLSPLEQFRVQHAVFFQPDDD